MFQVLLYIMILHFFIAGEDGINSEIRIPSYSKCQQEIRGPVNFILMERFFYKSGPANKQHTNQSITEIYLSVLLSQGNIAHLETQDLWVQTRVEVDGLFSGSKSIIPPGKTSSLWSLNLRFQAKFNLRIHVLAIPYFLSR